MATDHMASDIAQQRDRAARKRLGDHLRELRKIAGINQIRAGMLAGVSRWVWQAWESGRASIPSEMLSRAYYAVGVDVAEAIPALRAA